MSNTAEGWIDFQALKATATVGAVVVFFNLRLNRVGDEYKGFCPFHEGNGKDTSFSFHADKKAFHCFVCKRKGSILDFVQQYIAFQENRSCGIKEAGQLLAQAVEAEQSRQKTEAILTAEAKKPLEVKEMRQVETLVATARGWAELLAFESLGAVSRDIVKGEDAGDWVAVRVSSVRSAFEALQETLRGLLETMEAKAQEPHKPPPKTARRAKK